ncbi:MAG TPA: DNA/RNA nuclease SfsA [Bauldia sp.]|nr:DNA/RNA nuclease SfsA [Bauldia sp.]
MRFPQPLVEARLVQRYKRFFAAVRFADGALATAHCANTGAMLGLSEPGTRVLVADASGGTRTLPWSLEMVEQFGTWVGVNSARPNALVAEAVAAGRIAEFAGYDQVRREVRYGANSRVDFLLAGEGMPDLYVEVKNVHFSRTKGRAEFPDTPTERGAKHLRELIAMRAAGHRAAMLYLVQRGDAKAMSISRDLDPVYGAAFDAARAAGVEMLAYKCRLSAREITVTTPVPMLP